MFGLFKPKKPTDITALARDWFTNFGIEPASIKFSTYTDRSLKTHKDSVVVVGVGDTKSDHVGFAFEILENGDMLDDAIIEPAGLATYHKKYADIAKKDGKTLVETLRHAMNVRNEDIRSK